MDNRPAFPPFLSGAPWRVTGPAPRARPAALLGGLLFVLVFEGAYSGIAGWLCEVRDDAVITMSHAPNLVEHGSIRINPSGSRGELRAILTRVGEC